MAFKNLRNPHMEKGVSCSMSLRAGASPSTPVNDDEINYSELKWICQEKGIATTYLIKLELIRLLRDHGDRMHV